MQETGKLSFVKSVLPLDPLLFEISRTTYLENYLHLWEDEGESYLNRFYSQENFLRELQMPLLSYYITYVDHIPVGFFKINKVDAPDGIAGSLEIDKLYILKKFTGRQLGSEVLQHIEDLAMCEGYKQISLQVMDSSRAKFFYLKNGYSQVSEMRLTYPYMKADLNLILTLQKVLNN